jgi:hypothetical protein
MSQEPDYQRAGLVTVLTVLAAIGLFFVAKATLSFLLDHWMLTLAFIFCGVGSILYALIKTK